MQLMQQMRNDESGARVETLIYLACPFAFELTFPEALGGGTTVATIRGVLMFRAVTDSSPNLVSVDSLRSRVPVSADG
jgi:hypothetical protein